MEYGGNGLRPVGSQSGRSEGLPRVDMHKAPATQVLVSRIEGPKKNLGINFLVGTRDVSFLPFSPFLLTPQYSDNTAIGEKLRQLIGSASRYKL